MPGPLTMEDCLNEANSVFTEGNALKGIPKSILAKCKGVIVAHTEEVGLAITAGGGKGVMVKHKEDGSWGPPAALNVQFVSVGLDIGMASKYVMIVPMTDEALKKLTVDDKLQLGAELGLACGPGQEGAIGAAGASPIYTYTFQKGLILQAGLTGSQINYEKAVNQAFYGVDKSATEIVLEDGAVTLPEGNETLDTFYKNLELAAKPN